MTVRLVRGVEIARIAKTAGFDSLYVDMEHSSFSLETTGQICIAALEAGVTPLVRVPGVAEVQRVLDAGALGIIAPHVQSAAEARDYVQGGEISAARRALQCRPAAPSALPLVRRSPRPMPRSTPPPWSWCSSRARQRLAKADEIVAVEGVDMVLIGTNDLLADWGLAGQYEHPRLREAYAKTIAACRRHGKHAGVGGLSSRPESGRRVRAHGRALRVDRHRSRVPACRVHRQGEGGARHQPGPQQLTQELICSARNPV